MIVNPARGEVALELGGRSYTLCLTLSGLARLQALPPDQPSLQRLEALLELLSGAKVSLTNNVAELEVIQSAVGQALEDLV